MAMRLLLLMLAFAFVPALAGAAQDPLLTRAREIFQPLPQDMGTPDLPISKARATLGRMLFFDQRLTVDGNLSCSTCHQPARYGTDGLPKSVGVRSRPHARNAPTNLNAALNVIHWRGDRASVEDQVRKALTSPITSGQPDEQAVLDRLGHNQGYVRLFKAAFPGEANPITAENVAKAIGAYERTLVTPSPFDAYLAGKVSALSPAARAGLEKFINMGCVTCHDGVGIGGTKFRKFGLVEDYWKVTGSQPVDNGRVDVTHDPADLYVFRVPSLRNVGMTAPYFHDGSVATLAEAVRIMARVQLGVELSDADTQDIVAWLQELTGKLPANFASPRSLPDGS